MIGFASGGTQSVSQQAATPVVARQPRPVRKTGFRSRLGELKMANGARSARALLWGVSAVALCVYGISESAAQAQQSGVTQASAGSARPNAKQKSAKRSKKRQQTVAQAPDQNALNANAQAGTARTSTQSLDTITIAATKTEERAIDALAPVSVVTLEQIQGLQPNRVGDLLRHCPGRVRCRIAATIRRRGEHSRLAGFRPRRRRRRRRAAELSAHRPQREWLRSSSIRS